MFSFLFLKISPSIKLLRSRLSLFSNLFLYLAIHFSLFEDLVLLLQVLFAKSRLRNIMVHIDLNLTKNRNIV